MFQISAEHGLMCPVHPHFLPDETCKWLNPQFGGSRFQDVEIFFPPLIAHNGSAIAAGGQHQIHEEPRHASVPIAVRVMNPNSQCPRTALTPAGCYPDSMTLAEFGRSVPASPGNP
jgi:hypothetical protein